MRVESENRQHTRPPTIVTKYIHLQRCTQLGSPVEKVRKPVFRKECFKGRAAELLRAKRLAKRAAELVFHHEPPCGHGHPHLCDA